MSKLLTMTNGRPQQIDGVLRVTSNIKLSQGIISLNDKDKIKIKSDMEPMYLYEAISNITKNEENKIILYNNSIDVNNINGIDINNVIQHDNLEHGTVLGVDDNQQLTFLPYEYFLNIDHIKPKIDSVYNITSNSAFVHMPYQKKVYEYELYQVDTTQQPFVHNLITTSHSNVVHLTGLQEDTTYIISTKYKNFKNETPYYGFCKFTTDKAVQNTSITPPTNFHVLDYDNTKVTISWDSDMVNVDHFDIYLYDQLLGQSSTTTFDIILNDVTKEMAIYSNNIFQIRIVPIDNSGNIGNLLSIYYMLYDFKYSISNNETYIDYDENGDYMFIMLSNYKFDGYELFIDDNPGMKYDFKNYTVIPYGKYVKFNLYPYEIINNMKVYHKNLYLYLENSNRLKQFPHNEIKIKRTYSEAGNYKIYLDDSYTIPNTYSYVVDINGNQTELTNDNKELFYTTSDNITMKSYIVQKNNNTVVRKGPEKSDLLNYYNDNIIFNIEEVDDSTIKIHWQPENISFTVYLSDGQIIRILESDTSPYTIDINPAIDYDILIKNVKEH